MNVIFLDGIKGN